MTEGTVVELINEAGFKIQHTEGSANRERAIAITKLQEAQMWYTRARAIEEGVFNPKDLDK